MTEIHIQCHAKCNSTLNHSLYKRCNVKPLIGNYFSLFVVYVAKLLSHGAEIGKKLHVVQARVIHTIRYMIVWTLLFGMLHEHHTAWAVGNHFSSLLAKENFPCKSKSNQPTYLISNPMSSYRALAAHNVQR